MILWKFIRGHNIKYLNLFVIKLYLIVNLKTKLLFKWINNIIKMTNKLKLYAGNFYFFIVLFLTFYQ